MNKLHSFLFSLFSVATFLCSASEQSITPYNARQICALGLMTERTKLHEEQSYQGYQNFTKNADALKHSFQCPDELKHLFQDRDNLALAINEFRLRMAKSLKPIIQEVNRRTLIVNCVLNIPLKQSYRIQYLTDIQNKLRNIDNLTVTAEEIEQYTMVIRNIVNSTEPTNNVNDSIDQIMQQVYNEIAEENIHKEFFSISEQSVLKHSSEENKEIVNRMEQFIISQHQIEAKKATKNKNL